ncbi:hypothetical protein LA080_000244 [Diaporthe eres]|nr:hypothetical protein LA080_000244 [Diaporthe eres]
MSRWLHGRGSGGLLTWKDILPWQRDNEFILTGYRQASFSYPKSILSILAVHNESANIWSHLLGALWFLTNTVHFLKQTNSTSFRSQDALFVALYQLCISICFILSTFYHTFSDNSPAIHRGVWDTFAFYCHQALRLIYFALLTLTGLGCAVFTLSLKFRRPEYRTTRFLLYCFLGATLFAPVIHGLLRFGPELQPMMGLTSFLALALINFSGAAVYAVRIPERWYPGIFDLLGQNHNWMHVMVLTDALVRLNGLYDTAGAWQVSTQRYGLCGKLT